MRPRVSSASCLTAQLLGLMFSTGCRTSPPEVGRVVRVELTASGIAKVGERAVQLNSLPKLLKRLDIPRRSRILVAVPEGGDALREHVIKTLSRGGYSYVMFTTPRQVSAYVTPPDKKKLANPLAPRPRQPRR